MEGLGVLWEKLTQYFGTKAAILIMVLMGAGYYAHSQYQKERLWHAWVKTPEVHYHDQVIYKDGMIKVHWDKLPKVPNYDFEERWHLYLPGQGWIPIKEWDYQKNDVPPYRFDTQDFKGKDVDFWGDWVSIAREPLKPGTYEIRVSYHYDSFNWGVNHWEAEQKITFTVE